METSLNPPSWRTLPVGDAVRRLVFKYKPGAGHPSTAWTHPVLEHCKGALVWRWVWQKGRVMVWVSEDNGHALVHLDSLTPISPEADELLEDVRAEVAVLCMRGEE